MKTLIYGGTFNPPHLGHFKAASAAAEQLSPERLLIIPDNIAPHKEMADYTPEASQRYEMCALAFQGIKGAEVSDMEIRRSGRSYSSDTVALLREKYPEDELFLLVGTDMLLSFEQWHDFEYILKNVTLAVISREEDDKGKIQKNISYLSGKYGAGAVVLEAEPFVISSTEICALLPERKGREYLSDSVYSYIIKNRLYCAKPDFDWLREKAWSYLKKSRIPHVMGCEQKAVELAELYGADVDDARTAAILHDSTKKLSPEEQLKLCDTYGIINDKSEKNTPKLLHAKTGAELARREFGANGEVCSAIRWHTTGKPGMSLLEMIIYLADYIEPTRDFPGIEEIRKAVSVSLEAGMAAGLKNTIDEVKGYGSVPYKDTTEAYEYYRKLSE